MVLFLGGGPDSGGGLFLRRGPTSMGVSRGGALWVPPPPHLGGIRGSMEHWALCASVSFLHSGESPHCLAPLPPLRVQAGRGGGSSPIEVNMELLESRPPLPPSSHHQHGPWGANGAPPPTPGPKWDSAPLTPMPRGQRGPGTAVHRTRLCSQPELNPPPRHSRRGPATHTHTHTQCHTPCHTQICHPHPPLLTHTPGKDPIHSP